MLIRFAAFAYPPDSKATPLLEEAVMRIAGEVLLLEKKSLAFEATATSMISMAAQLPVVAVFTEFMTICPPFAHIVVAYLNEIVWLAALWLALMLMVPPPE